MQKKNHYSLVQQLPASSLRSEAEIIASWDRGYESSVISINCVTYNHEQYIEDTIIGFLIQETTVPFEILIHDDASTDGTALIIQKYEKLYPKIIKPLYQSKNQYSQGVRPLFLNARRVNGQYMAVCEGDDYWLDPNKLQAQFEALKGCESVNICYTRCFTADVTKKHVGKSSLYSDKIEVVPLKSVIRGGGWFMPTATIMVETSALNNLPAWVLNAPVGDYFLQVIGSLQGGALFLPDVTSVYRKNVAGSWSKAKSTKTRETILKELLNYYKSFEKLSHLGVEQKDISYMKSLQAYLTSIQLIRHKDYTAARDCIEESWGFEKKINSFQVIIYKLRRSLFVIYCILKLRDFIK